LKPKRDGSGFKRGSLTLFAQSAPMWFARWLVIFAEALRSHHQSPRSRKFRRLSP
jgi:hypothetical protein